MWCPVCLLLQCHYLTYKDSYIHVKSKTDFCQKFVTPVWRLRKGVPYIVILSSLDDWHFSVIIFIYVLHKFGPRCKWHFRHRAVSIWTWRIIIILPVIRTHSLLSSPRDNHYLRRWRYVITGVFVSLSVLTTSCKDYRSHLHENLPIFWCPNVFGHEDSITFRKSSTLRTFFCNLAHISRSG